MKKTNTTATLAAAAIFGLAIGAAQAQTVTGSGNQYTFTETQSDQFPGTGASPTVGYYDLTGNADAVGANGAQIGEYIINGFDNPKDNIDAFSFVTSPTSSGNYLFTLQATDPAANNLGFRLFADPANPMPGLAYLQTNGGGFSNPASVLVRLTPNTTYYFRDADGGANPGSNTYPAGYQITVTDVPEPASTAAFAFTLMGVLGLILCARVRRSRLKE